jgi:hypothetical protein
MEYREVIENRYFPILEKVSQDSQNDLPHLRYKTGDEQQMFATTIYCAVLELSVNIFELIKENRYYTVPILLRTLLEAHADLINVSKDKTYPDKLFASYWAQKRRFLDDALKFPEDPFFQKIVSMEDAIETLDEETKKLKEKGIKPVYAGEKFHSADLGAIKASVYWYLCQHTHNNLSILEDKHVKVLDGRFGLEVFRDIAEKDKLRYIDTLASIWIESSKIIHEFLRSEKSQRYAGLITSLNYCRDTYSLQE